MRRDRWSRRVVSAAVEVHRALGPGLPGPVYRVALAEELRRRGIPFEEGKTVPIRYRGLVLVTGLELDLVVGEELIVETLSVERITDWHCARLLTHLRLSGCRWGVLINFDAPDLERGVRRMGPR
ncbi:MAG TPA: GxxExxY protein [Myxococcales bacterium]|nr:GxxExxY protein [Myxococcales bacterium]